MSVIGNMTSACGLLSSFSILEPLTPYVEEPNGFSLIHSNCHHYLRPLWSKGKECLHTSTESPAEGLVPMAEAK